jgi:hypothetical protein
MLPAAYPACAAAAPDYFHTELLLSSALEMRLEWLDEVPAGRPARSSA